MKIVFDFAAFFDLPRPGVEPGLEVPETSVMSFSLPGRDAGELRQYITRGGATGTSPPRRVEKNRTVGPSAAGQIDSDSRNAAISSQV